jgi:D-3-phosphoglycerate dehydrogenase
MEVFFDRPPLPEALAHLDATHTATGPDLAAWPTAAAVVAGPTHYDAAHLDAAPGLRVVARTGIGVDSVDLDAATERGVIVCNTPDGPTISTAEHTMALLLLAAKRLDVTQAALRAAAGNYHESSPAIELAGRTLGLVGYGRIGRLVARMAESFGMSVLVHDPFVEIDRPTASLDQLLAASDVVSLHLPLTPDTRHLLGADRFSLMRRGAILVNCARGGLVDHDALVDALDDGMLSVAALDVTEPEPLAPDHPLLHRDDVIVTPHVASATHAGRMRMQVAAIGAVNAVLAGERPEHVCNPAVLDQI